MTTQPQLLSRPTAMTILPRHPTLPSFPLVFLSLIPCALPPLVPSCPRQGPLGLSGDQSIMQNKPNSRKSQTHTTSCIAKSYENNPPHRARKNKPNQTQFANTRPNRSPPFLSEYRASAQTKTQPLKYVGVVPDYQNRRIEDLADVRAVRGSKTTGRDARAASHLRHSALRTIRGGICWGLIGLLARSLQLLLLGYQPIVKRSGFIGIIRFLRHANIIAPTFGRKKQKRFHPPLSDRMEGDLNGKSASQNTEDRRQRTEDGGHNTEDGRQRMGGKEASKREMVNTIRPATGGLATQRMRGNTKWLEKIEILNAKSEIHRGIPGGTNSKRQFSND